MTYVYALTLIVICGILSICITLTLAVISDNCNTKNHHIETYSIAGFQNRMQMQVEEFHRFYGVAICDSPQLLALERNHLRLRLIAEEAEELAQAMLQHDLVECADALGDLLYVTFGCAVEMGLDMQEIVDEIHRSNLSKLGADGQPILDAGGKVLKGPNYSAPDIARVIAAQKERRCKSS